MAIFKFDGNSFEGGFFSVLSTLATVPLPLYVLQHVDL